MCNSIRTSEDEFQRNQDLNISSSQLVMRSSCFSLAKIATLLSREEDLSLRNPSIQ